MLIRKGYAFCALAFIDARRIVVQIEMRQLWTSITIIIETRNKGKDSIWVFSLLVDHQVDIEIIRNFDLFVIRVLDCCTQQG